MLRTNKENVTSEAQPGEGLLKYVIRERKKYLIRLFYTLVKILTK